MRKIVCLVSALLMVSMSVFAADVTVSAQSAILYDCTTGKVIYEKQVDEHCLIASTTKIMTGLLASEIYNLEQSVIIDAKWCGAEGSSMYLTAGETVSVKDLLYGLMLMSGNDAAMALSCIYSGDSSDFVELMNRKAAELGLKDTHFSNPSGLDEDDHYSTARDMARLAHYALNNPTFAAVCATRQIETAGRFMTNHNKLLFLIPGAAGVKTGYTDEAGRCLVSAVERDGRKLIAVTFDAPDDWNDHEKLYDMGFYDMRVRNIIKSGMVGYVYAAGKGMVELGIDNDVRYCLTAEEIDRLDIRLTGERIIYGSRNKGELYGEITVRLDGAVICREPVYFCENIEGELPKQTFWDKIKGIFTLR